MQDKEFQLKRRREIHQAKRETALANVAAKVAALGDDALFDEYEEATYIGKSVQWLRNCRVYGGGPPVRKIGAAVRYRLGDQKT